MAYGGRGLTVLIDEAAINQFCRSDPAILRDGQSKAERVTQEAKRLAPVSPHGSNGRASGYLRSEIRWDQGIDSLGVYWDISTPALSVDGFPYGLAQEVGTSKMAAQPHIRPALDAIVGP